MMTMDMIIERPVQKNTSKMKLHIERFREFENKKESPIMTHFHETDKAGVKRLFLQMDEPLDLSLKTQTTKQEHKVIFETAGNPLEQIINRIDTSKKEFSEIARIPTTLRNDNDVSVGLSVIKQVKSNEEDDCLENLRQDFSNRNIPTNIDDCFNDTANGSREEDNGNDDLERYDNVKTEVKCNRDDVFQDEINKNKFDSIAIVPESYSVGRFCNGIEKDQDDSMIQRKPQPAICKIPCPNGERQAMDVDDATPIEMTVNDVTLCVVDSELWRSFKQIQNEMIINRGGRRMFPYIAVTFRGLRPTALYDVILEIVSADQMRYKYVNDAWVPVGRAETFHTNAPFVHHECPCYGEDLMRKSLSFSRVKLTNSKEFADGKMLLQSMCKYTMRISVVEREKRQRIYPFLLKETTFIAVTAYQNSKITNLKIQNNPFAKAFRKSRQKRQSLENPSSDDEEIVPKEGAVSYPCSATLTQPHFYGGPSLLSMRDMTMYSPWFQGDYRMLAAAVGYQNHLIAMQEMEGNKKAKT
ncbi:hypothetical protein FSP39_000387 [Pinctada imbricata]|uniref:T-box domain-containing protein n=1 Tax=Pinctada imbricata TaxID=66713 RepID=A0AA88Y4V7_PINIB|nr:hypothetical protein FSP39_000387 [Pinctada imbricata]